MISIKEGSKEKENQGFLHTYTLQHISLAWIDSLPIFFASFNLILHISSPVASTTALYHPNVQY